MYVYIYYIYIYMYAYMYIYSYIYIILVPATLPGYYFVTYASSDALRLWHWDSVWLLHTGIFVSGVVKTRYNVVSLFLERAWYLAYLSDT